MDSDRELLLEIRDLLSRHAQTYAAWVEHLREREAANDEQLRLSLEMQRSQGRFYRVAVLVGLPLFTIIAFSILASTK